MAELAAEDGTERWRRLYDTTRPGPFAFDTAVLSIAGDLVLAGGHATLVESRFQDLPAFTVLSVDGEEGALDVCGDGFLDQSEDCEDPDTDDANCCSACRASPDGTACDDGDLCTTGDACTQGACRPRGEVPCEPCGVCTPLEGCRARPFQCRVPTASEKATLTLVDKRRPRGDALTWQWRSGEATSKSDFGDPIGGAGYALW